MLKPFKVSEEMGPFDLIFHAVSYLDAAGKIAEEQEDVDQLIDLSNKVRKLADDYINTFAYFSSEGLEEGELGGSRSNPVGFQHS